jgi:hypothetical protein
LKRIACICTFWLLTGTAFAQGRGGPAGGGQGGGGRGSAGHGASGASFGHGGGHGGSFFGGRGFGARAPATGSQVNYLGLPPVQANPPLIPFSSRFSSFNRGFGFGNRGFGRSIQYPYGYSGYGDYDYDYEYPPSPQNVIVVQQPPPPAPEAPQETPPPPVQSQIRDYNFGTTTEARPSGAAEQHFVIALKDGTLRSAVAVWAAGDSLNYVDPDGRYRKTPMAVVDRDRTNRLNRDRHLQLQLPPPSDE